MRTPEKNLPKRTLGLTSWDRGFIVACGIALLTSMGMKTAHDLTSPPVNTFPVWFVWLLTIAPTMAAMGMIAVAIPIRGARRLAFMLSAAAVALFFGALFYRMLFERW